jgi:hypothetical protein
MVTNSLGMAGNPIVTLLVALVIITIQVGVVQGNAYWTFMSNLPIMHPITWQSHYVPIFSNDMVHMGGHSSEHLVQQYCRLWQLRQQILAMQKAYDDVVSPANVKNYPE